jgi:hypothetical protein
MVLLLGSRGRSRGRGKSGLFSSLGRVVKSLIGGSGSDSGDLLRRSGRRVASSGWIALVAALACFAGGYLAGSHFGAKPKEGDALKADGGPRAPGVIEFDASPINNEAFIVSYYRGLPAAEAKTKAKELCDYLRTQDLKKARPYEWQTKDGPLWVAAVYFDGPDQEKMTSTLLRGLPADVPDATFVSLRNSSEGWPRAWKIR